MTYRISKPGRSAAILALIGGVAFGTASASAHDTGYGTSVHSHGYTTTSPSHSSTTTQGYAPAEPGVTYSYIWPSTTPSQTYTTPSYTTPTYTTPTYTAPSYTAPTYATPTHSYTPAPIYDATAEIRRRLKNQRRRIDAAESRGALTDRERQRLKRGLRRVRQDFREFRADGIVGPHEARILHERLDRNSRRIARLAHNDRFVDWDFSPFPRSTVGWRGY